MRFARVLDDLGVDEVVPRRAIGGPQQRQASMDGRTLPQ